MKADRLVFWILFFGLFACSKDKIPDIRATTTRFYEVYNKRNDVELLMGFYAQEAVLEDIINGDRIQGISDLKNFFAWDSPGFQSIGKDVLKVQEVIVEGKQSVVKGVFSGFKWGETEFEAMHFTTILTFNDSGKITKQVDWINYPSTLVDYSKRKNANLWIN